MLIQLTESKTYHQVCVVKVCIIVEHLKSVTKNFCCQLKRKYFEDFSATNLN